ncbi:MAG: TlpA family protein disulfide reductase [Spirochaetales bacterium]|nr:TlpA family protein disulfide reductase [Spirochaetales bacterium]
MKTATLAALAGLSLMLAACAPKPTPAIDGATPPQSASSGESPALIPDASTSKPWYADRLETLGFFVFPEPVALPPFTLPGYPSGSVDSSKLAGKVTLLNFWATWCPPCKQEMPSIEALWKKMRGEAFDIVAISVQESRKTVETFMKEYPYTFPIYLDESGAVSGMFVSQGIPTTFILDKTGMVIAGTVGGRSYDGPELVAFFKELAAK